MRNSKTVRPATTTDRALNMKMRRRYLTHGQFDQAALVRDFAQLEARYVKVSAEVEDLRRGKIKLDGLVARYERSTKKDATEIANLRKKLASVETMLKNETARAEKFKAAYNSLRNHPVVRTARGLKAPFLRKQDTREVHKATETIKNSTMVRKIVESQKSGSQGSDEVPRDRNSLNEIAKHIDDFRIHGNIVEPIERIRELLAGEEIPSKFAMMFHQLEGQARLLQTLPAVPPKTNSPAYVPRADKVMYCAHSTGEYNSNGYSTRTTGLTSAIVDAGYDLFIAARPGYPWDSAVNGKLPKTSRLIREFQGVKTHFNPGVSLRNDPLDKFIQISADIYAREAIMNRPSVISAASNHITALPALIAARRLGIPFMYEVRGLWEVTAASSNEQWANSERFKLAVELESLVACEADQVFAITEEVREELVRRGVARERIQILPNAANIFKYVPLPSERSRVKDKKRAGEYLLGYAGSLVGYEGLDLLVDAVAQLPESHRHVGLLVAGDGAELAALRSRAVRLGVQDRVRFVGRVPNDQVNDYLAIFDAVVCPRKSNIITELVSPLKPIEAMAAGRPVLGSDVAPIKTLLGTDSSRGLLFTADDVESLKAKIRFLADNPQMGQGIGRRARQWTVQERTWPLIARTFTEAVQKITTPADVRGRKLSDIRMALIADQFTTSTIQREVNVIAPTPSSWREEFAAQVIDVLFVESAWAGNNKSWTRKIGYYDDEQCSALNELVEHCRSKGIPTIFWNKEDPVHFNRFQPTAELFDVVLTTDANCLPEYWESRGSYQYALGSMPFWAQPEIHNPLDSRRSYSHTIAYGGSYYGDRFAERSAELRAILEGAKAEGLTIYDRQADNPDSPYRFPSSLQPFVRGGLPYEEMVEAYKSHPVHINVNSVNSSPTMFSRRVFELAACGTPQISGKSFGVTWLFDGKIPVVRSRHDAELISGLWMQSERDRVLDAWGPLRIAYEKHLAKHRLAVALRMAGIAVEIPVLPQFAVALGELTANSAELLRNSSLRPAELVVQGGDIPDAVRSCISALGIQLVSEESALDSPLLLTDVDQYLGDEYLFEDLLIALVCSQASSVEASERDLDVRGLPLWLRDEPVPGNPTLRRLREDNDDRHVRLRRMFVDVHVTDRDADASIPLDSSAKEILVAGHDLKFAGQLLDALTQTGHHVSVDQWVGHAQHDPEKSLDLLANADVIFCEWSLGNLVWYSKNKKPEQRLVTRFHSQELFTDYPNKVDFENVDQVIFVSDLIRGMAVNKFGIPEEKTSVIANPVAVESLNHTKQDDSRFVLGFVGIVPQMKRFDLVLDLLEELRKHDARFELRIKGKRPEEYQWMAKREEEMAYYNTQYDRIESSPLLKGAVTFDPHGNDMAEWYRGIGIAVSTSDFESFHFTLADGAASQGLPVGLAWPGSEWIYPQSWLFSNTGSMASYVLDTVRDDDAYSSATTLAKAYAIKHFDEKTLVPTLASAVVGN